MRRWVVVLRWVEGIEGERRETSFVLLPRRLLVLPNLCRRPNAFSCLPSFPFLILQRRLCRLLCRLRAHAQHPLLSLKRRRDADRSPEFSLVLLCDAVLGGWGRSADVLGHHTRLQPVPLRWRPDHRPGKHQGRVRLQRYRECPVLLREVLRTWQTLLKVPLDGESSLRLGAVSNGGWKLVSCRRHLRL